MDQALLVKSDKDIGARVIAALNRARLPVTLFDWNYVPELEEWHLIIASPWVDEKGPLTASRAFIDALQRAGVYEDVPMRRIFLRSPNDPIVKSIQEELTRKNSGFLHILKNRNGRATSYTVIFAPTSSAGGFAPTKMFASLDDLKEFLMDTLGLKERAVEVALDEMQRTDVASLNPVILTTRQIKRFG